VIHAKRGRPIRLDDSTRILSLEESEAIARRVRAFAKGGGFTGVSVMSWWNGELRWARNRVSLAGDRRDTVVSVSRSINGVGGSTGTNQLDDASLEAAVRHAEQEARFGNPGIQARIARSEAASTTDAEGGETPADAAAIAPDSSAVSPSPSPPRFEYAKTTIWSQATHDFDAESRGKMARTLVEPVETASMLSAGYLEMRAAGIAFINEGSRPLYAACTQAQCSTTVRDPKGTGSGWAGLSSYDWAAIDAPTLAARALDKCERSRNPVALEPGRYTVILEPQAVCDLVSLIVVALARQMAEGPTQVSPFWLRAGQSKLGLKVIDERVTIDHDPSDPALGVIPFSYFPVGEPYRSVRWIDRGVLANLATDQRYTVPGLNERLGYPNSQAYRMSGGSTSVEEMIKTTKRGLLVTRFSNIRVLDGASLLCTGLTRDGLWLIENGAITKPVKNFRFTESPLFMLNSIEQLGIPVPVFRPVKDPRDVSLTPTIVPAVKSRDFSFTAMIDAV
jgi:predicted Zn-dependent protease